MRLDKFLADMNLGTRNQVKEFIKKKMVTVDGMTVTKPDTQIDPRQNEVCLSGKRVAFEEFQYYVLNKPAGVVSATRDVLSPTVLSLLPDDARGDLFPVGRLDKDTEGLLLISNDGELAHQLLSPKKHVSKTYLVKMSRALSEESRKELEDGVDIGDDTKTLPAKAAILDENPLEYWLRLTISEGRFHQVRRMLGAYGIEVLYLKRIRFGTLHLDRVLAPGQIRKLGAEEIANLKQAGKIATQKKELMKGKKAVIFDMDGSLVDSMWIWEDIDRVYLGAFGHKNIDRPALKSAIEGMSFHETAVYIKEHYGIPDSVEKMKSDWNHMAWDRYEKEVPLKEGALEFLQACRDNGIKLGIATSNSRELVDTVLKANRVKDYFQSIVTGSEVLQGKPAPDIYLETARQLDVSPDECLVFEDIIPGIMAGRNAGMTVCAVADADSSDQKEGIKALSDFFVEDFYDFF